METAPPTDAATQIAVIIAGALTTDSGIHAETAIVTAGVLTGEFVLRASGFDFSTLDAGTAVFSDLVNRLLFEEENELTVSDVFMNALFAQGIEVNKSSWPETIPDVHQVVLDPLHVVAQIRPQINALFVKDPVATDLERAYIAAQATAYLVAQTRRVLDPNIGKTLALEAMLRGAKTVPFQA